MSEKGPSTGITRCRHQVWFSPKATSLFCLMQDALSAEHPRRLVFKVARTARPSFRNRR
jgi:hypothetical protein